MEYKVDIRFLSISILVHFCVFTLLTFWSHKNQVATLEPVEVVYEDKDSHPKQIVPHFKEQKKTEPKDRQAHFLSDQQQRFDKETIAQNMGAAQNSTPKVAQKKQAEQEKTQMQKGPSLMPMPSSMAAEEARESTINFVEPNISKGQFTFLNSDFSTYASFYNRITPQIMYQWGNNIQEIALFPHMRETLLKRDKWSTRIELILDRRGYYKTTTIVMSSGSAELDQAVVNALKNATPFINPPTGMIESDGSVHIEGDFTLYTERPRIAN